MNKYENAVENTTATSNEDPLVGLVAAMCGIENQEAKGQRELVKSDVMPVDLFGQKESFIAMGFEFGDPVPGDKVFQYAKLPEGWKKQPTNHSMWSNIVDAEGRVRVNIFYKAAFYDRAAHASLAERYSYDVVGNDYDKCVCNVVDRKHNNVLYTTKKVGYKARDESFEYIKTVSTGDIAKDWAQP